MPQGRKNLFEQPDHPGEGAEIGGVPFFVIFRKRDAVPKPVIKYGFIRMGDPKAEIRLPQRFHGVHGVCQHGQRIKCQMVKNRGYLFVYKGKAFHDQLILAFKIPVQRSGGDTGQIADVLDAHSLQAILAHGFHCGENDAGFGIVQNNHFPLKQPSSILGMYYTPLSFG